MAGALPARPRVCGTSLLLSSKLAFFVEGTRQACVMLNAIVDGRTFSLLSVSANSRIHLGRKSNNELNESQLKAESDMTNC
jgi:hypothetical protein